MLTGSLKIFSEGDSLPEGLVRTIFHQLKKGGNMLPSRENEHEQMFFVSLLPGPPPAHSLRHTHTPAPLCPLKLLSLQRAALGLSHRHVDVISIYSPWSTPMLNGRVTKGEHKVTS